jgi:hypothetical protein
MKTEERDVERYNEICAPVAQLDRASGFEPEGREFESLRARQFTFPITREWQRPFMPPWSNGLDEAYVVASALRQEGDAAAKQV